MNNKYFVILYILVFVLAACSGNSQSVTIPVSEQNEVTVVPPTTQTFTPVPSDTPLPTASITATTSITPTATRPPENSVLAESGYDFANVQISYPSKDQVSIDLQYQIAKYDGFESHAIALILPPSCKNARNLNDPARYGDGLFYTFKGSAAGHVQLSYTQTSEGGCNVPNFYLVLYSPYDNWAAIDENIVYRERIDLPIRVARNLPVINEKTLTVKNFSFQATGPWTGELTFEYVFSPEIPVIHEQYYFLLDFTGQVHQCNFFATGPQIFNTEGTYTIATSANALNPTNCRDKYDYIVYDKPVLYLFDKYKSVDIYTHSLDLAFTLKKSP